MQTRAAAALMIDRVVNQRQSLTRVFEQHLGHTFSSQDNAFIKELCFGVIRWYFLLEHRLEYFLNKPFKPKDSDIKQLLLIGLYQINFLNTPEHAAVSATVEACTDLKKTWAKKLVNAILRNFIRRKQDLTLTKQDTLQYSHPDWITEEIRKDWPEHWQEIVTENQATAPLTLRINISKTTPDHYIEKLNSAGIDVHTTEFSTQGIIIDQPCDITTLPGFQQGEFSVQDEAAQFAASLLDLKPQLRVLDACAAPGGKTSHCLELQSDLAVLVALDSNSTRLNRLQQNLERLDLQATCICGDASEPETWWDGQLFDRILLDVPCTASGIIRRHPDIKFLRQKEDLITISKTQQTILHQCWRLLDRGGKLLYSTCSVFKAENDHQIHIFLKQHSDAELQLLHTEWGIKTDYGRQILPGRNDMDGFYYSCIIKK